MNWISGKYVKTAAAIWGISLAVFVLAFLFVIKPQMNEKKTLQTKYQKIKDEAETARRDAQDSTRRDLQEQIDAMKSQLDRFVMVSKDDIQDLATIVVDMSKGIGLEAFNIDPWSGGEIPAFSECKSVFGQSIDVTFNASFDEFAKFLNMLERYKSVVFVDTFSITKSSEENAKHKVEMNLAVLVEKPTTARGGRS
ncbi:MAG: type 4a pilus biogenesis protein PilO [Sedimentisphaerales bacterium]